MIVIPMAGLSSRFTKAGYKKPKFMLELGGQSIFAHSVKSFKNLAATETFVFICREDQGVLAFIHSEIAALDFDIPHFEIVVLDHPTTGQAETVHLGLKKIKAALTEHLTIFNIDTFRPDFQYPLAFNLSDVDGYLEVFSGEGDGWSFVLPSVPEAQHGAVLEVTEKVRISDLCSTGLYYFRTIQMFFDCYEKFLNVEASQLQGGERYVAPLYNDLISSGKTVLFNKIESSKVIFCGTPAEYENLCLRNSLEGCLEK